MSRTRWQQIKGLLDDCAELAKEERAAWLDSACPDPELRREVESYLAYEGKIGAFDLSTTAHRGTIGEQTGERDERSDDAEEGDTVGPYRLEGLLGRGGMGAVYRARRTVDFEQRVALKLVRSGFETPEMVERFHTERQILANLEHPNIARLLDGGTSHGRPYFVMELVDGIPLNQYCDEHRLSVRQRLGLILKVCDALAFAHRNLVLHLDLKPSNILVTREGEPKLLDFGIGKLLARAQQTVETGGPRRMTLPYASPEQLGGEPLATSSDLYSLGVVLYDLLTGRLPCGAYSDSPTALAWAIYHELPRPPSTVVRQSAVVGFADHQSKLEPTTVARTRERSPAMLSRRLRGDLDAILGKALAKEPTERYASVEQLGLDLRRHLDDLPVLAHGDRLTVHILKFVRRNRWALAVATLVLGLSLGFTIALSNQLDHTERQRQRSVMLSDFLVNLFRAAEPDRAGQQPSVRELVDIGRERLESALEDEPEARAQLLGTLGEVYYRLGFFEQSDETQRKALDILRRAESGDHPEIAKMLNDLAVVSYTRGLYAPAEDFARASVSMRERLGAPDQALKPRNTLASILMLRGNLFEAKATYGEILQQRLKNLGERHPNVAVTLRNLATVHYLAGRFDEAESLLLKALDIRIEAFGPESAAVATVLASLGRVEQGRGDAQRAEGYYRQALDIRRRLLGEDHLNVGLLRGQLASLLLEQGELDTAAVLFAHAFGPIYRHRPEGDWGRADLESAYGAYLAARGRREEARICLEESYQTLRRVRGPNVLPVLDAERRLNAFRADGSVLTEKSS